MQKSLPSPGPGQEYAVRRIACGILFLGTRDGRLSECLWLSPRQADALARTQNPGAVTCLAGRLIDEYLDGRRQDFDIPIAMEGSPFRLRVWQALRDIPYGTTESYSSLARRIGRPRAVRAVANAVAANPISIFVPCHRIIRADGSPGGYEGGPEAKDFLLRLEGAML